GEHEARRSACEAERDRSFRQRRLLRHAGLEIRVRSPHPLREATGDPADLALELLVDPKRKPRGAREQLDRAVVVRRPEAARDDAEVRLEAPAKRGLELVGPVADDLDAGRLEPEPEHLPRQEGPVEVGAISANELAPGDDEDRARPGQAAVGARLIPFGETSTIDGSPPGKRAGFPSSLTVRFCGAPAMIQSRFEVKSSGREPGWSVTAKTSFPLSEPLCTSSQQSPQVAHWSRCSRRGIVDLRVC